MALVSAKKNRLEGSAAKGDRKSKTALELKENPDVFLSTTQIYITLISILTGVYSGEKFGRYLKPYLEQIRFYKTLCRNGFNCYHCYSCYFFIYSFWRISSQKNCNYESGKNCQRMCKAYKNTQPHFLSPSYGC